MTNLFPKGVRKVNEKIVQSGRTLIFTTTLDDKDTFDSAPFGSLRIDPVTGDFYVKIESAPDQWQKVDFGKIDQGSKDPWNYGDFPMNGLTEEEATAAIARYTSIVKNIELAVFGENTFWNSYSSFSDHIRQIRNKIIFLFESLHEGGSTVFALMEATDARSAISVVDTGTKVLIEIISGFNSQELQMVRLKLGDLINVAYPIGYIVNEYATIDDIASDTRDLLELIGHDPALSPITEEVISGMSETEATTLIDGVLDEVKEMYNVSGVQQAAMVMSMRAPEAPRSELLERIQKLESELSEIKSLV